MTQTAVAADLIRRSMYLINAFAAGETPEDSELNDGLTTLNEMLDSWNLQTMAVYRTPNQDFVLTPGQASYDWGLTAGPTGIVTERPVFLNNVTCVRSGVTTPVEVVTQVEYDRIALKTISQPLVEKVLYINSFPLGKLVCYPVPSEAVTLTLGAARQVVGPILLADTIALPPGYLRAIRYCLAVELWPEYTNTTTDINTIKLLAAAAFGKVKVANTDTPTSTFEDIPNVQAGGEWDWRG
jgi:hypothetical protein